MSIVVVSSKLFSSLVKCRKSDYIKHDGSLFSKVYEKGYILPSGNGLDIGRNFRVPSTHILVLEDCMLDGLGYYKLKKKPLDISEPVYTIAKAWKEKPSRVKVVEGGRVGGINLTYFQDKVNGFIISFTEVDGNPRFSASSYMECTSFMFTQDEKDYIIKECKSGLQEHVKLVLSRKKRMQEYKQNSARLRVQKMFEEK